MHEAPFNSADSTTFPFFSMYPHTQPLASANSESDFLYSVAYRSSSLELLYNSYTTTEPSGKTALSTIFPEASNCEAAIELNRVRKNGKLCPLPLLLSKKASLFLYQTKPASSLDKLYNSPSMPLGSFLQENVKNNTEIIKGTVTLIANFSIT